MNVSIAVNRRPDCLNLKIGSESIIGVDELKILGVIFDRRLSFKSHIETICKKMNTRVNVMSRIRYYLPINTLNLVFKSLVYPLIDYCICVYGFTFDSHLIRIQKIMRRAAHIILSSDQCWEQLFKKLKWISFIKRRDYFSSIFIHKCLNGLNANKCHKLFNYTNNSRTRSATNRELKLPNIYSQSFKNTIFLME